MEFVIFLKKVGILHPFSISSFDMEVNSTLDLVFLLQDFLNIEVWRLENPCLGLLEGVCVYLF